jgi:Mlc titration factor MtfA (ptsG expression regulator)
VFSWLFSGHRRRNLLAEPVPDRWRQFVERNVGIFALLPQPQQQRLLSASRVIAVERHWVGCRGLEVTDEIKATVSAQAAILLLGVEGYYFDKLQEIYLVPGDYALATSRGPLVAGGSVSGIADPVHLVVEDLPVMGQASWTKRIVLSWSSALAGGRDPCDGQNVVLHEFAHHLDSLDGDTGGRPPLPSPAAEANWDRVIGMEYDQFLHSIDHGERTLLEPSAAESLAEFFAYGTELFFERPVALLGEHPAFYEILRDFYHVDPAGWHSGARSKPPTASKTCPERRRQVPRGE